MKIKYILFSLILFLTANLKAQQYELVWADEFDKMGSPDNTKWSFETGGGGWGNSELQYYTNRSENARVENGYLVIEAKKESYQGSGYTSARLITTNKGDWKYGKIVIRAKLPSGKGTWPAIWMLPTDWAYGGWPSSGELDIMEHVGYDKQTIFGTAHTDAYNHVLGTQQGSSIVFSDCETAFHDYSIVWTADKVEFYVDDIRYYTFTNQGTWQKWPFDQRFHLLLNIAVGGSWGGAQGIDDTAFPTQMKIDYVHIYQELSEIKLIGEDYVLPNETSIFEVNNIVGATYNWTIPADAQIVSGQGTNSIELKWGQTDGTVSVVVNRNQTETTFSKDVLLVTIPSGGEFLLSNFSDNITADIIPAQQTGNTFTLSESDNALRIDYSVANHSLNPYILFQFDRPVYLAQLENMWLNLKTFNKSGSVTTRYDLIDINGLATDITPLFKIEQPNADGEFHEYGFNFTGRWQTSTSTGLLVDSTKVAALKMYIDYGFFGKDSAKDSLWIKDIKMSDVKAGITYFQNTSVLLKLWPNPATDEIEINLPAGFSNYLKKSVYIYNQTAQLILQQDIISENVRLNISNLPKGYYLVKVIDGKRVGIAKLVK
jgi:beta-glucanase (GH16 family)